MTNARNIIDYAMDDNGAELRNALYASIYDKVSQHIDSKKQEIAHKLVTQEETDCATKGDAKKIAKKEVKHHEDEMHEELSEYPLEEIELEEGVSRKHFQQVADLIASHDSHDKRKELAQHHATIFAMQNPRFDRAKFMKAANVQE